MTYAEKLKDPRWQKRRLQILKAAKFRCEWCWNTEQTLHVHHFSYPKSGNPWEAEDCDLICICEDCHTVYHMDLPEILEDILVGLHINPKRDGEATRWVNYYILKHYAQR